MVHVKVWSEHVKGDPLIELFGYSVNEKRENITRYILVHILLAQIQRLQADLGGRIL